MPPKKKVVSGGEITLANPPIVKMTEARIRNTKKKLKTDLNLTQDDIHKLYQKDLDEKGLTSNKKEPKTKEKKEAKTNGLSKYRQQVREALDFKNKYEKEIQLELESESDDDAVVQQPRAPTPPPAPAPEPAFDVGGLMNELETLKKQNKELQNKFQYRNTILDATNMRRNMVIKF